MSDLNLLYASTARGLSLGSPLKRKSGLRNAAPQYFHFNILHRQSIKRWSLSVRSQTPAALRNAVLSVCISPLKSVIETSVNNTRNAPFNSLKFFTAVMFMAVSFFFVMVFAAKNFVSADFRLIGKNLLSQNFGYLCTSVLLIEHGFPLF